MNNFQRWKGIMKCVPFEEKRLAKWQPPFIIQPKYDGVRCRAVPLDDGNFLLLSSEENPIFSVPHINEACKKQLPQEEFDGELYSHWHSFEEIVSITSRTVNLHPDHALISFYIFDKVTIDVQAKRTREITDLNLRPPLVKAPFWLANNLEEVMKVYDTLINQNYEGIIVRQFEAIYVRRRSNQVMKFKPKKEDTYKIIGYQEEVSIEGNPKGRLGALICESGDGNTFNVGTGFDDYDREYLWSIKETLPGSVAKVQYQHLTTGKKVPRFPVFVEIVKFKCPTCKSEGFERSILDPDRCTFCDGTFAGLNPLD